MCNNATMLQGFQVGGIRGSCQTSYGWAPDPAGKQVLFFTVWHFFIPNQLGIAIDHHDDYIIINDINMFLNMARPNLNTHTQTEGDTINAKYLFMVKIFVFIYSNTLVILKYITRRLLGHFSVEGITTITHYMCLHNFSFFTCFIYTCIYSLVGRQWGIHHKCVIIYVINEHQLSLHIGSSALFSFASLEVWRHMSMLATTHIFTMT